MLRARQTKGQADVQRDTHRCARRRTGKERQKHRRKQAEMGSWRDRVRQTHGETKRQAHTHTHQVL